jgi:hypothetical protein
MEEKEKMKERRLNKPTQEQLQIVEIYKKEKINRVEEDQLMRYYKKNAHLIEGAFSQFEDIKRDIVSRMGFDQTSKIHLESEMGLI